MSGLGRKSPVLAVFRPLPPLHPADIDRMQACLLAQLFLAQTCPLAEGADVRSSFLPNFVNS